jgi:hypothetical protein
MQPSQPLTATRRATADYFMKRGFISPNLPGHRNPMTALARHLQARNHEVVFLYSAEANGLPVVPGPGRITLTRTGPNRVSGMARTP